MGTAVVMTSCTDVEVLPRTTSTENNILENELAYKQFLAKLYAGYSTSGQSGPAGSGDIGGIDEGFSQYLRQYWQLQELPTEEAVISWSDGTLFTLNLQTWDDQNEFVAGLYYRIFYQVGLANEFLRAASDSKLDERGFTDEQKAEVATYRTEARFIRAFSLWHALDMFGNVPFATEADPVGTIPGQVDRQFLFDFIEQELNEIESELPDAGTNEYGRADKAALWTLQAKLYLNAEVYTGEAHWTECITACKKVIESGAFEIESNYQLNFMADNHTSKEIIFAATFDGLYTRTWGGTTYLVNASIGGSMTPTDYGVTGGWWGLRATSGLVDLFPVGDNRALFWTDGQTKEISEISEFTNGYAVPKYVNITSTGENGSHQTHPDTDFPFFRLADVYLMYAEAVVRGGTGGDVATATGYVNELRERAYGDASGNILSGELTADFILDERGRELYWEGHRRTDLIRFKQFTENGIWPWKGGVAAGEETSTHFNLYPIPSTDLLTNTKLTQNEGY